ncbi:hypothetical protein [Paenibacillus alkalitolerans]|uniref:hypothetical protein n=1 Tax=Paenibacillus alkalitolerans TaxID=2799335 RepID=UPI0018F4AEAE|nr:hypothetical protein [Paenibacillus alkalitolerans]
MIESLFPSGDEWLTAIAANKYRWFAVIAIGVFMYGLWRSHWRTRYARRMKQTFDNANLFVKPKKDKLFPELIALSDREDNDFYVFRYRLRPGMTIAQFEEKKKVFEAAFHRKAEVYGKGAILTIKIKKYEYRMTADGWTSDPLRW